jgi:general secretion pathway protein A
VYRHFFNLRQEPFGIVPDPQFFYPTDGHNEAAAGLLYGIHARKGLMVLSGEVGTGKSLILRCLLQSLDRERIAHALIVHSRMSTQELLHFALESLGLHSPPTSKAELLLRLNWFLTRRDLQGLTTVFVIDEAQHLSVDTLEEIRLLTNLEAPKTKLLQIVLAGQPELDVKLDTFELRQLKQRIAMYFQLRPLSEQQTSSYILSRLKTAGCSSDGLFSSEACQRIFAFSQGVPRLINVLCENALVCCYAHGERRVTSEMVDEIAADLRLKAFSAEEAARPEAAAPALQMASHFARNPTPEVNRGPNLSGA